MLQRSMESLIALPVHEVVEELLRLPEDQWYERKSGSIQPKDLAETIVGMANAEGGVIAVGLHNGSPAPVSDKAANAIRQAAIDFTNPRVRVLVDEIPTDGGRIMLMSVAPSSDVHETKKGDCFQRIGDETRKLTFRQRQELEWDRGFIGFDGAPAPDGQLDDLDAEQLEEYRELLGSSSGTNALRARDLIDRDGQLRVAGYLLFAKNPQRVFPNAYVRVVKYSDNERGAGRFQNVEAGKDIRIGGSLPQQIAEASRIIEEFLPGHRRLTDAGTFADVPIIPREAWLEGLVNAVVHRSYGIAGDHIRVEIFPNRIEFTSPGRFPGLVDISHPEKIGRKARNPRIARVFFDMGITQELGEGIRRIFEETRRAGLAEPLYVQLSEAVHLTLLASNAIPEEIMRQIGPSGRAILDALRLAQQPLGTGQITELVDLARPTVLRHLNMLRDAGVLRWNGKSPRDPRATWELL
ncbi:ATP-binding protein [Actinotignum schaalii]|uniref:ATP-binding protein n=1 Tax=Actinotignum schaalii TaxID=59505 RepID=UPI0004D1176E|nr:ATP-binding protein [Actinotignum schaalii]AIE82942.1 hypothetical protein FB03_06430 [Actinotignum schaalii]WQN45084.1 ATP-binding protein [Actinotignum schaalii]